jgi:hypothetical protein
MRVTTALLYFATLALSLPPLASGQDWDQPWSDSRDRPPRVDINASVGVLVPTDWSDLVLLGSIGSFSGVLEQVVVRDLQVEPATVWDGAATYWRGRYGFRAHVGLSRSSLRIGGASLEQTGTGLDRPTSVDLDTWFYDVRGAIGFVDYRPDRRVWPYGFIGFGGITYDLTQTVTPPLLTFIEGGRRPITDGGNVIIVADDGRQFVLAVGELKLETVFALNVGVGADFRIPIGDAGLGIRFEASDTIAPSPLGFRVRELGGLGGLSSDIIVDFGFVHHLRVGAGMVVQLGR